MSLAAFSVVASRPSRAAGRYLVLRITRRLSQWTGVGSRVSPGRGGPVRARRPSLGSSHPGRCSGLVTWPYAAGLVAGTAADSPATSGILSRPQVLRGAVQARREPDFVVRVLAGLSGRRPGRPGPAFPAATPPVRPSPRPAFYLNLARDGGCSLSRLAIDPRGPGCPGPGLKPGPGPGLRPTGVACARNREGAAGLPLGMSNNA